MKDKSNLLTHNQWSAGEYYDTISQTHGLSSQMSKDFSTIGETSYKIIRSSELNRYWELRVKTTGNIFTASCQICSNIKGYFNILLVYVDGSEEYNQISFSGNYNVQNLFISKNANGEVSRVSLRIVINNNSLVYLDNPSIITIE